MTDHGELLTLHVPGIGDVDALLFMPQSPRALYVLAHGAGAPMRHAFMDAIARALAARGVATLRYNFPYAQAGRRGPDRPATLEATVRAALERAHAEHGTLPLFAGGKSMGGRMTSQALADSGLARPCTSSRMRITASTSAAAAGATTRR